MDIQSDIALIKVDVGYDEDIPVGTVGNSGDLKNMYIFFF
jgi:hypothetical protein